MVRATGRAFADAVKNEISERVEILTPKFGIDPQSVRAVLNSAGRPTP